MVLRISVRRRRCVAAAMVPAIDQHVTLAGCAHLAEGDLLRIGSHGSAPYQRTMHFETIVADVVSGLGWPDWVPGITPRAPRAYQRARPRSLSPLIGAVAVRPVDPGPDKKLGARPRLRAGGKVRRVPCRATDQHKTWPGWNKPPLCCWFRRAGCASDGPDVTTSMQATAKFLDDLPQVVGVLFDNPQGFL